MRARRLSLAATAVLALAVPCLASAADEGSAALAGRVSSVEEVAMEGVVVSARKADTPVTISVVTDAEGRYSFPSSKLESGLYALRIRATGWEFESPVTAEVVLAKPRLVDLKLRRLADITPQMTNAEWIASFPGTPDQKKFLYGCVIVDRDGIVWISQFDEQFLGKFDPRTLKYTEFAVPVQRPDYPKGTLDLEVDPEGNLWLSHMFQSGIVKFDKKAEKFQAFPLPAGVVNVDSQQSMVGPQRWTVDRKVWLNDAGIPGLHRLA
jgi:hypothetical protein